MSIIRAPRPDSNFYMLDKAISEDKALGWAARGLLIYLLGKPDHWSVSVQALVNDVADSCEASGRDRTYALIKQLIEAGYIVRQQGKGEAGKFASYDYLVSEKPLPANPLPALPYTAQPLPANPTLVSIEVKQELKERVRTEKPSRKREVFDAIAHKPECVSEKAWADWAQHRKEIRKPLTAKSVEQQAAVLAKCADPAAVISKSITNGWTGLFPDGAAAPKQAGLAKTFDQTTYLSTPDDQLADFLR